MDPIDHAGLVIGQAESIVDSPETVAVTMTLVAIAFGVGCGVMGWACFHGQRRHLSDLRTMLPALQASTSILNDVARSVDHQTALIQALMRRDG